MRINRPQIQKPISKEKVKAALDIMDICHAFSGQVDTRPKQPLILCPFHQDKRLGSCRVYADTNTFYCESCQTSGDALKLASGYMGIPLTEMNELLEAIVSRFGIDRDSVTVDSNKKPTVNKKSLLSVEGYRFLNFGKEYFEIPIQFYTFEFENDEIESYIEETYMTDGEEAASEEEETEEEDSEDTEEAPAEDTEEAADEETTEEEE